MTLGEILTIESEIAKAKTNILQLLHNVSKLLFFFSKFNTNDDFFYYHLQVIYGKNGSSPQIKRNIRRFPGFEFPKNCDDYRKAVDRCLEYDLPKLVETAKILKLDNADMSTKELVTDAIMEFLLAPYGRTIAQEQRELKTARIMQRHNAIHHPEIAAAEKSAAAAEDQEEEDDEEELGDEEEEEEEEPATKKKTAGGKKRASDGSRPKRATAARVWTNNYGSSDEEEDEEVEEEKPKIRKKNNKGGSDSGSDVSLPLTSSGNIISILICFLV